MTDHALSIRKFIANRFLFGDETKLRHEDSLLEAGIVDSTGILELIAHLETTYGIKIKDEELLPENLDSIANICAFLARKGVGPAGQRE